MSRLIKVLLQSPRSVEWGWIMKLRIWLLSIAFSIMLFGGGYIRAQVSTATIRGTVADSSGSVITGASIVATQDDALGRRQMREIDTGGGFTFMAIDNVEDARLGGVFAEGLPAADRDVIDAVAIDIAGRADRAAGIVARGTHQLETVGAIELGEIEHGIEPIVASENDIGATLRGAPRQEPAQLW